MSAAVATRYQLRITGAAGTATTRNTDGPVEARIEAVRLSRLFDVIEVDVLDRGVAVAAYIGGAEVLV